MSQSQSQGDSQSTVISILDLTDFKFFFVNSDGERILIHYQCDFRPDINCGGYVDNDFIFEFAWECIMMNPINKRQIDDDEALAFLNQPHMERMRQFVREKMEWEIISQEYGRFDEASMRMRPSVELEDLFPSVDGSNK